MNCEYFYFIHELTFLFSVSRWWWVAVPVGGVPWKTISPPSMDAPGSSTPEEPVCLFVAPMGLLSPS